MIQTKPFTEARADIRSGDLLFFEPPPILPPPAPVPDNMHHWLVRAATGHKWIHVGIAIVWTARRRNILMIEADLPAVRVQRLGQRLPCAWLPLYGFIPEWTNKITDDVLDAVGEPYGYLDALRLYAGLPPAHEGITCCELAVTTLQMVGMATGGLGDLLPEPLMIEVSKRADALPVLLT